jgi:hypothetical protein
LTSLPAASSPFPPAEAKRGIERGWSFFVILECQGKLDGDAVAIKIIAGAVYSDIKVLDETIKADILHT